MEKIEVLKTLIKMVFINLSIYYVYTKIINYKSNKKYNIILEIIASLIIAYIYVILAREKVYTVITMLIIYTIYAIILSGILKTEVRYSIIITIISFIVTYIIYLISIIIAGNIIILIPQVNYNSLASLFIIISIAVILFYFLFKIKRINNGINFLKNIRVNNNVMDFSILFGGMAITLFGLLQTNNSIELNTSLFTGMTLIAIFFIIWLQSQITKHYKKNMRDRTISVQKAEIDEQTKLLEEVEAENLKLATAVHKYNHRLSSLELAMKSAISHNLNTEFAEELSVMLKDTEDLSNSFAKECDVAKCILPLTNVPSIDNMFKYMQDEASKCNINFDLKINESINDLIDKIIPKDMFETLLGDHLRDAIIAVNASDNSYKSILTTLGLVDGCYELSVYDTGIEFQIDTLLKLGKEQVTTHKDSGGSGIGFMTTFETLKTTKASLVIEEYNPETTNYTKSVSIRFDGKNQYRIYSYRADDIKKQNKEKRIIVKNIE